MRTFGHIASHRGRGPLAAGHAMSGVATTESAHHWPRRLLAPERAEPIFARLTIWRWRAVWGLIGLYLYVELVHADSVYVRDGLAGLLIGGSLGIFLNAYRPFRDGAWLRLARGLAWGVPAAASGGAIGLMAGEVVIGLFRGGLFGRALSWSVLGLGIELGQGLADRSRERLFYGLLGGGLGGFIGGFVFEWLWILLGDRYSLSQAVGITILGAGLGMCLALVEQVLRRVWVQVLNGRQEGRNYLLSHQLCRLGLDVRAEIGIFGDPWSHGSMPRSKRLRAAMFFITWR